MPSLDLLWINDNDFNTVTFKIFCSFLKAVANRLPWIQDTLKYAHFLQFLDTLDFLSLAFPCPFQSLSFMVLFKCYISLKTVPYHNLSTYIYFPEHSFYIVLPLWEIITCVIAICISFIFLLLKYTCEMWLESYLSHYSQLLESKYCYAYFINRLTIKMY